MADAKLKARQAHRPFKYERLDKTDTALLIVDLQIGLSAAVRDWEPTMFRNNMLAHAALGKLYDLPTIMTTSADTGPNGPMLKEILDMYPDAPLIQRQGEVNAWDNKEFREAVKATGKSQVILASIMTDVCACFLALSLREAGYHVALNADSCGTHDQRVAVWATNRMQAAGVDVMNHLSVCSELFRDWRSAAPGTGSQELKHFDAYWAGESFVLHSHLAAVRDGRLLDGEAELEDSCKAACQSPRLDRNISCHVRHARFTPTQPTGS